MRGAKKWGFILHSRKMYDRDDGDPLWRESRKFSRWEAWADLIQLAAFADTKVSSDGVTVVVPRGHFVASVRLLAGRWQWGHGRVLRFLSWMKDEARVIPVNGTPIGTLYRLVNYELYQSGGTASGTRNGTATERQRNEKKEVKERKPIAPLGAVVDLGPTSTPAPDSETFRGADYAHVWESVYGTGAEMAVERHVRDLKAMQLKHGRAETLARWERYLRATPSEYASASKLRAGWPKYAPDVIPLSRPGNGTPPTSRTEQLRRMGID